MRRGELFDLTELRTPLSFDQEKIALRNITEAVRLGSQFMYTIKEACGILGISRDMMNYLIHTYRLDALAIGTIYRIPWYSLAEYILDKNDDDIEEVFNEYVRSRHRAT